MLARPDYRFWISQHEKQIVAFAIVHISSLHRIALLEYMAVHPDLRGRGLGRGLLEHLLPRLRAAQRSLVIEVESDKPATPDRSLRTRRKQFYLSFNARQIAGLAYLMPQVSTGTPPPMDLLVCLAQPSLAESSSSPSLHTLAKPILRSWLTGIYVEVYGQSSADPRLVDMLATLPDTITLL